jgi:BlaI family transcriptional regulator, penicillinase repressor
VDEASKLSRRERQIMDVIWRLGQATVADVLDALADAPSYSAVRALLNILKQKGQLDVEQVGARYVYRPTVTAEKASRTALHRIVETFFGGEPRAAIAALASMPEARLSKTELESISRLIDAAKKEGR